MKKRAAVIEVEKIDLDKENPRIKAALENPSIADASYDELRLQLEHAMSAGGGSRGWRRLRSSIKAAGRALQRITVVEVDDRYVCIDGNTRVAIYKDLQDKNEPGDWGYIEADIIMDSDPAEVERHIERVRMISHIVGPRDWSPYRRAKYLHALRYDERMSWKEIVELCGGEGNRSEMQTSMDAYELMEDYRRQVPEDNFKEDRYSAFEEMVKLRMVKRLEEHGKSMEDFNRWVEKGVLRTDAEVRDLRKVLADDEAREELEREEPRSLERAIAIVKDKETRDRNTSERTRMLREATVLELATWLVERLDTTTMRELREMESRRGEIEEIGVKLGKAATEFSKRTSS